ncbi:MAG: hypothetical protein RIG63_01525 [Coleofasciculus chthonoplastes F3-SA18-01]|uniref:hypothetical protein n=1 Tax=Coleofasciculus chthonoplastes TaxID=64178 RepID=UPI0032F75FAA
MSLHRSFSTPCPDTSRLGDWQSAGLSVEFFIGDGYGSIEQDTAQIRTLYNSDVENLTSINPKPDHNSGKYRRIQAVPI